MARFVHTPYTWPGADIGEIDTNNCTSTYSCLERVPSIRHWWHTYITGSHVFKFQIDSMGRNPRAVDAVCDELVTHIITVFGAHTGSLSSELVQNAVKRQRPILYELVIGWLFHRRWHDFILQYTIILTLVRVYRKTYPIANGAGDCIKQNTPTNGRWLMPGESLPQSSLKNECTVPSLACCLHARCDLVT
jgi:hypothetical protein